MTTMQPLSRPGLRGFAQDVRYGAVLIAAAARPGSHIPGRARSLLYSLLTALLGLVALVPVGITLLVVVRGLLYGFVDRGPYDDSWGGPSLTGAWLTHVAVGVPLVAAAALMLWLLARLHRRVVAHLDGTRPSWWVVPVTVLVGGVGLFVVVAWTRQI
jgi:hypothetical protein